jgi:D-serine deaminase-like pyridoxal phosphate-dependent protein
MTSSREPEVVSADNLWYEVRNIEEVPSPALLLYPDRIEANVREMLRLTGGPERLRPHIKTHKIAEVLDIQLGLGIKKFKAATIAECEMAASRSAADVLLAYQPVGPTIGRLIELMRRYPQTKFSTVADNVESVHEIDAAVTQAKLRLPILLDVDCGQHRTGIAPGPEAVLVYQEITKAKSLQPGGLHGYDGHVSQADLGARREACNSAFSRVIALRDELAGQGFEVPKIVAGGTPTFGIHAARADVECSPGTCVLWDFSYGSSHPDLGFVPAALVVTRVISKPTANRVCVDLGHKAVASENPHPRVRLLGAEDARFVSHSEEHLVFETDDPGRFRVGDVFYGVPWHVCPTVALHNEAVVIRNHMVQERWPVVARNRRITI